MTKTLTDYVLNGGIRGVVFRDSTSTKLPQDYEVLCIRNTEDKDKRIFLEIKYKATGVMDDLFLDEHLEDAEVSQSSPLCKHKDAKEAPYKKTPYKAPCIGPQNSFFTDPTQGNKPLTT
jgi:hypothetical protein